MAFIDGEERPLASLSTEALIDRFTHPVSNKEECIIRKILENRGVLAPICNPYDDLSSELMGIKPINFSIFANPLLDPTRFKLGVDLAKYDSPTELKIKVKRHNIKFNFNN